MTQSEILPHSDVLSSAELQRFPSSIHSNKSFIKMLNAWSMLRNIQILAFRTNLTLFGPYAIAAVLIFVTTDQAIG